MQVHHADFPAFAELQGSFLRRLGAVFADLQRRGCAGTHLSASQLALVFEIGVVLRSFSDIAPVLMDDEEWLDMVRSVLSPSTT